MLVPVRSRVWYADTPVWLERRWTRGKPLPFDLDGDREAASTEQLVKLIRGRDLLYGVVASLGGRPKGSRTHFSAKDLQHRKQEATKMRKEFDQGWKYKQIARTHECDPRYVKQEILWLNSLGPD